MSYKGLLTENKKLWKLCKLSIPIIEPLALECVRKPYLELSKEFQKEVIKAANEYRKFVSYIIKRNKAKTRRNK
jgi:hypothetical protein